MATISLDPAGNVEELQVQSLVQTIVLETTVINASPQIAVDIETTTPPTDVDFVEISDDLTVVSEAPAPPTTVFPGVTIAAAPLVGLPDVDITGLENNSLLLYNSATGMWKPSKKLEDHFINAGQF